MAFHPYHTSKDLVIIIAFLIAFSAVVFFAPDMGGYFLEHANFEPANTLQTPPEIAPVWYFTPFYAILRAVPNQRMGALLMLLAGLAVLRIQNLSSEVGVLVDEVYPRTQLAQDMKMDLQDVSRSMLAIAKPPSGTSRRWWRSSRCGWCASSRAF